MQWPVTLIANSSQIVNIVTQDWSIFKVGCAKLVYGMVCSWLCFYNTIIQPVLEYASPVWHSSLTVGQYEALESLQSSVALKLDSRSVWSSRVTPEESYVHHFFASWILDYSGSLFIAKAGTLEDRLEMLARCFFKRNILNESSCLHYLLPEKHLQEVVDWLWSLQTFEHYSVQTEKLKKSFIPFCVNNYQ